MDSSQHINEDNTLYFSEAHHPLRDNPSTPMAPSNFSSHDMRSEVDYHVMLVCLIVVFVASCVLNVVVLFALILFHKGRAVRRLPFDILMLNVVFVDLLLLIPMWVSIYAVQNDLNELQSANNCQILRCADYALQITTVLLLSAVSVERYKTIDGALLDNPLIPCTTYIVAAVCWFTGVVIFPLDAAVDEHVAEFSYWELTCVMGPVCSMVRNMLTVGYYLLSLGIGMLVIVIYTVKLLVSMHRFQLKIPIFKAVLTNAHLPQRPSQGIGMQNLNAPSTTSVHDSTSPPATPQRSSPPTQQQQETEGSTQSTHSHIARSQPTASSSMDDPRDVQDTSVNPMSRHPHTEGSTQSSHSYIAGSLPATSSSMDDPRDVQNTSVAPVNSPPPTHLQPERESLHNSASPLATLQLSRPNPSQQQQETEGSTQSPHSDIAGSPPTNSSSMDDPQDDQDTSVDPICRHPHIEGSTQSPHSDIAGSQPTNSSSVDDPRDDQDTPMAPLNPPPPAQLQPERKCHLAVWVMVFSVLITCGLCFVLQVCSNLYRLFLPGFQTRGYYAFLSRLLLYLVAVLNPLLYVLYRWAQFRVQVGCSCWWCRRLSSSAS